MKKEIKNKEETKEFSKETKELIKNVDFFELLLAKDNEKYYKEMEKALLFFLEHYNCMKKSINYIKKEIVSKEVSEELEIEYLNRLMKRKVDDPEMTSEIKEVIANYKKKCEAAELVLKKTEKCLNFFTNIFNYYIEKNISLKNKIVVLNQQNNKNKRKYRSAILLKRYYMNGEALDEIEIYNEDVYCTSTSEYQKKFVMDRKVLVNNLAPMIYGMEGIGFIKYNMNK